MALVVAGGGLYMYAQYGMQQLARGRMRYQSVHGPDGGMNLAVWGDLLRLSRLGVGLAAAGVAVALVSFVRHRRTSSRAPIHEQADHS